VLILCEKLSHLRIDVSIPSLHPSDELLKTAYSLKTVGGRTGSGNDRDSFRRTGRKNFPVKFRYVIACLERRVGDMKRTPLYKLKLECLQSL